QGAAQPHRGRGEELRSRAIHGQEGSAPQRSLHPVRPGRDGPGAQGRRVADGQTAGRARWRDRRVRHGRALDARRDASHRGAEATITLLGISGFTSARALSERNDDPEKASRPFDKDRDGFVPGEGAGILILEELEHARRRGARIYCELTGYAATADAFHITQPSGSGAERAMQLCLQDAGLRPEQVQYVNAHGTSTPVGDTAEVRAITSVVGDWAKKGLIVSSTKSMTGHLLGAAGGVEAGVSAPAAYHGIVPPTINVEHLDPQYDLDVVPNQAREVRIKTAVSNSFGFGG